MATRTQRPREGDRPQGTERDPQRAGGARHSPPHLLVRGVRGPTPSHLLLPHTGQAPAPRPGQQRGPGQGRAGCRGPTLACSCCFCRPICCSISSYSCCTSRWWSESRLEGVGGGPGSASVTPGPAAARGSPDLVWSPSTAQLAWSGIPDPRYPGNSYPNSSP